MGNLITKMTPEQEARMPEFRDAWIRHGLNNQRADFQTAIKAWEVIYKETGIPFPKGVVRVQSPIVGALAAPIAATAIEFIRKSRGEKNVRSAVDSAVRSAVGWAVGSAVRSAVYSAVDSAVDSAVGSAVGSAVDSAVGSAVGSAVDSAVGVKFWHYWIGGSLWPAYASWFTFMRDVLGVQIPAIGQAYETQARSAGYAWPNRDFLIICDRPADILLDAQGRLHGANGKSIHWRDGWGLYHWHGVEVPAHVIEEPAKITVREIEDCKNAEVRRVMIERYGQDRYLVESGAKEIHRDDWGVLYRKDIPDDEPLVMVKVVNSTPEPDGTFKDYFLRVPPEMRRAKQAVAWTFDKSEELYAPTQQT